MKKCFLLVGVLAVLASCTENQELPIVATEQEPIIIDLQSMNYEGVMNLLSEQTSLKEVTFTDGVMSRHIDELKASDALDPLQAEMLVLRSTHSEDSVELTVSPDYVTVRTTQNGQQTAYVAYANEEYQQKMSDFYSNLFPATRGGEPVVTRNAGGAMMKMNITALGGLIEDKYKKTGGCNMGVEPPVMPETPHTRGWFSNLFKKVATPLAPKTTAMTKTPTVDIYLLKEKGANPLEHEMKWQVNDAIEALKDVQSNVKFNVYIDKADVKEKKNAETTLNLFDDWVRFDSKYSKTKGIFVLCRWDTYGLIAGMAFVNDYSVNRELSQGVCISATSVLCKYVMAHEISHILGAHHVGMEWWEAFTFGINSDLMSAFLVTPFNSGKHKNSINRRVIEKNLTLNE